MVHVTHDLVTCWNAKSDIWGFSNLAMLDECRDLAQVVVINKIQSFSDHVPGCSLWHTRDKRASNPCRSQRNFEASFNLVMLKDGKGEQWNVVSCI